MTRLFVLVCVCAFFFYGCGSPELGEDGKGTHSKNTSEYVERVETMPAGFFRVWADIKVKSSGEIINLDYVVACGGQVTHWTYTEPSAVFGMYPHIMVVPTSTGAAIGARTPQVCDSYVWEEKSIFLEYGPDGPGKYVVNPVPDDFLPLLMWYPSVEDLSFAFGYISDVAYESPYAKMEVQDSGIAKSSQEEWLAWREKSKSEYQQQGALPGPWGYQMPWSIGSTREETARIIELNGGRIPVGPNCYAVGVVELPDSIKADVLALLPENGREWVSLYETSVVFEEPDSVNAIRKLLRSERFNGGSFVSHEKVSREDGVRRRNGGGAFKYNGDMTVGGENSKHDHYHRKYPIAAWQLREGSSDEWEHRILLDDDWEGFGFCGKRVPPLEELRSYAQGERNTLRAPSDLIASRSRQWLVAENKIVATNTEHVRQDGTHPSLLSSLRTVIGHDGRVLTYVFR